MSLSVNTSALRLGVALGLFTALASCGGGGGNNGVGSTPTPPPTTPPKVETPDTSTPPVAPPTKPLTQYDDSEYRRSAGSVAMDALAAYSAGATGKGVTVAVIDSGINTTTPEFAGRIASASRDIAGQGSRSIEDSSGHGTAVASVIAGARNGAGAMGVAFDSTVLALRTDTPSSCASNGCSHLDSDLAMAVDTAVANGARVINMSLGGNAPQKVLIDAIGKAAAQGIVVVVAAGNDGGAQPNNFSALATAPTSQNMVIIAGSHSQDGQSLSEFSNAAGGLANHYMVALGERVRIIDAAGKEMLGTGTSFSAPQISGAVALIAEAFPHLSGAQIVDLLYKSAIDLGDAGVDSIFGRGKLSLTGAFQPQGQLALASNAAPFSLTDNGSLGAPMGDAGRRASALGGAIILDGYSRAYAVDLAATLSRAPVNHSLASKLAQTTRSYAAGAGNVLVNVSVQRDVVGARPWVSMAQAGLTAEDTRIARTRAGTIISRVAPESRIAFGFSQDGFGLTERMAERSSAAFLLATDPRSTPGFEHRQGQAVAVRHRFGRADLTLAIENGDAIMWQRRREQRAPYTLTRFSFDYDLGSLDLSLGLGLMDEKRSILGSQLSGAFGTNGATTQFTDFNAVVDLADKWQLGATVRQGRTAARTSGGLVEKGNIITRGFAVDLTGRDIMTPNDQLGLRVSQPLRVENGGFKLRVPVAYDYLTSSASIETRRMSLTPTGREIDVEASYSLAAGQGRVDANLYWRRDPGHIAELPNEKGIALRYSMQF